MPSVLYETLFALDSTKVSADGDGVRNALHANLEKYGAKIDVARPWDENGKLAYPIKKQKKAYFYIVYYHMDSLKQVDLERDLSINENVLRQLTSKLDAKWADTIMEIARTETGSRFSIKAMVDDSAPTGEGIVSNDPLSRGEIDGPPRDGPPRDGPPRDGPPREGPRPPRRPRGEQAEKPE